MSVLLDLLDEQHVFSQRRLLTPKEFLDRAEKRRIEITAAQLIALHRSKRLMPLYWIRDVEKIGVPWYARDVGVLREARDSGNLCDPRDRPAALRAQIRGDAKGIFLYSDYQVLALHMLGWEVDEMDNVPGGLKRGSILKRMWRGANRVERLKPEEIALLSLLEPKFFPRLVGRIVGSPVPISTDLNEWAVAYEAQTRAIDEKAVLRRCGVLPDALHALAETLIMQTHWIDPNRQWLPLTRQMAADRWRDLLGPARLAIDFRLAAEILLRGYESLVETGAAPRLPEVPPMATHPLAERLKADPTDLDSILTGFGLSPHPSLVLVVEGDTEVVLLTRAFRKLGLRNSRNFIEIVKRGGISKPIDALLYLLGPEPEVGRARMLSSQDALLLGRPSTRVLVTGDAEGDMATPEQREVLSRHWVQQIREGLLDRHDVRVDPEELKRLVATFTWGPLPFEFACFTDAELARAVNACRPGATTAGMIREIRKGGRPGPEYKGLLRRAGRVSKRDIAYQLWPILEAKLDRKLVGGSGGSARPIIRLFAMASRLATEWPRANLAMRLDPGTDPGREN